MLTWSETLYRLYQKFGGNFLGCLDPAVDNAILHLDYQKTPLTLEDRIYFLDRNYSPFYHILTTCELERPYRLELRPKNLLDHGLALVKADSLLTPYPELKQKFALTTNHPDFTATVLRQASFRAVLPKLPVTLQVRPTIDGQPGLHQLKIQFRWNDLLPVDPTSSKLNPQLSLEGTIRQREQFLAECARSLDERIIHLMDLAVEARAAVTAYRML